MNRDANSEAFMIAESDEKVAPKCVAPTVRLRPTIHRYARTTQA